MAVTIIKGNIFDSQCQTLVNAVNCVGVMGKGIALTFKQLYPDMYISYRGMCANNMVQIGEISVYNTSDRLILNFPTKRHWRDPSKIEWVELGLNSFVNNYKVFGITSVAFPLLGAGNGGLNPIEVQNLMVKYLSLCNIPIEIYQYS